MNNSRTIFATAALAISLGLPAAVQAELLQNTWTPLDTVIPNDPQNPCGQATFFHLEGMVHTKVSTLRNGGAAWNINIMGTFTPLDGPNQGESSLFRENAHDVLPQFQDVDNAVWSVGDFIRIISPTNVANYKAHYNFHVVISEGEVKSYFETDKVTCN